MYIMDSISRVMDAIRRKPGALPPKGELTIDRSFAVEFLSRYGNGGAVGAGADVDLLIAIYRALKDA